MPWSDPLLAAVQYKTAMVVRELLETGKHLADGPDKTYITPLEIAILNDDADTVKVLIHYGANVNLVNNEGEAALHLAAGEDISMKTFKTILKSGADISLKNKFDHTPLHIACLEACTEKIVVMLRHHSPPVNMVDDEGATPIHLLLYSCEFTQIKEVMKIIKLAIRKGFDVSTQTFKGETILHVANVVSHREEFTSELIQVKGLNCTIQDESGHNFIHYFLQNREGIHMSEEFLFNLLSDESSISKEDLKLILNHKNYAGKIPLCVYITRGIVNTKLVQRMIEFLGDVDVQDKFGLSLLHTVTHSPLPFYAKKQTLKYLIKKGANVNIKDIFGRTPLFFAYNLKIIVFLVENGANVNTRDQCKRTPLMTTLSSCNPRVCQYLINKGAQINSCDKFGCTVLHYAAWENRIREVEVLIQNGADLYQKDRSGQTPLDVALFWRCKDSVIIIQKNMLETDQQPLERKPPELTEEALNRRIWVNTVTFITYKKYKSIENIREHFEVPNDVVEYIKDVMAIPGIGLPQVVPESDTINSIMVSFINGIASKIGEMDKRFKCSVFRSGSTSEGTKVDDPNEYDFLFILDEFSKVCSINPTVKHKHQDEGFERPVLKQNKMDEKMKIYFDHENALLCGRLRNDFFSLASRILMEKSTWVFDEVYIDDFSVRNNLEKPIINVRLHLVSAMYKGISVSLDIVPCLRLKDWTPSGARLTVDEVTGEDVVGQEFLLLCQEPPLRDAGCYFRLSCAPLEIKLMQSFPAWIRQSYALAKILKGTFMCPKIKFDDLFEEAGDKVSESKTESDDDNNAIGDADTDSDDDNKAIGDDDFEKDDDNIAIGDADIESDDDNNAIDDAYTESDDDNNVIADTESDDDNIANGDDDGGLGSDDNEGALSGNSTSRLASEEISSYMLKNCLFHVVQSDPRLLHELPFPNKSILYNSLSLTLRMYEFLRMAAVQEKLQVYFLPYLNIFDIDDIEENELVLKDESGIKPGTLQKLHCKIIHLFSDFILKLYQL